MITSERDIFVGAHVTIDVKVALRIEARRRNITMSRLVYDLLAKCLRESGHQIKTRHSPKVSGEST